MSKGVVLATMTLMGMGLLGSVHADGTPTDDVGRGAIPPAQDGSVLRERQTRIPIDVAVALNGRTLGSMPLDVDQAGGADVDVQQLERLLEPILDPAAMAALKARAANRSKVDLADLSNDRITLTFDPLALQLDITAAADAIGLTRIGMIQRDPIPDPKTFDQPRHFSIGTNLSIGQRYQHGAGGPRPLRGTFDTIANIGGFGGYTLTLGGDYDGADTQAFRRREIRLTHDAYGSALRYTAGEFTPNTFGFQGNGRILGIALERNYSTIRPFQNVRPGGRQLFTLQRESSVDVFVNDIRLQTLRLKAGRYDIADFPLAAGPNRVRLEVEDSAGRTEIASFDLFSTGDLLGKGVSDFGFAAGLRERATYRYAPSPIVTARYDFGLTDALTLGGNGQASSYAAQAGIHVISGSRFGFFQLDASVSRDGATGHIGRALSFDYRADISVLRRRDLRLSASVISLSRYFGDAFQPVRPNLQSFVLNTLVQWQAPYQMQVGLGIGLSGQRIGPLQKRIDTSIGRSFGRFGLNATLSAASTTPPRSGMDWRFALSASLRLGRRTYANARYDSGSDRAEVEVTRSPNGELDDINGSLRLSRDRAGQGVSGRLAYVNNRFDAQIEHNRLVSFVPDGPSFAETTWSVSTFVGYAGGALGVGRAISDGFVIATRHPTLDRAALKVRAGSRVVARSGRFGPATFGVGRAYGINRYDLDVDPLPLGYDIGSGALTLFPGFGSGYRSVVGSDASRTALGILENSAGPASLVTGVLRNETDRKRPLAPFFTNRRGRFIAEKLVPGRYAIVIDEKVVGTFLIPETQKGMVDVGIIRAR